MYALINAEYHRIEVEVISSMDTIVSSGSFEDHKALNSKMMPFGDMLEVVLALLKGYVPVSIYTCGAKENKDILRGSRPLLQIIQVSGNSQYILIDGSVNGQPPALVLSRIHGNSLEYVRILVVCPSSSTVMNLLRLKWTLEASS